MARLFLFRAFWRLNYIAEGPALPHARRAVLSLRRGYVGRRRPLVGGWGRWKNRNPLHPDRCGEHECVLQRAPRSCCPRLAPLAHLRVFIHASAQLFHSFLLPRPPRTLIKGASSLPARSARRTRPLVLSHRWPRTRRGARASPHDALRPIKLTPHWRRNGVCALGWSLLLPRLRAWIGRRRCCGLQCVASIPKHAGSMLLCAFGCSRVRTQTCLRRRRCLFSFLCCAYDQVW